MNRVNMYFFGKTDTGKLRENNEDAFVAEQLDNDSILAIVIDGVGGYEGGEVAAGIAQKEIPEFLKEYTFGERLELLKRAVVCANNVIYDSSKNVLSRAKMCCVLTAAIIDTQQKKVNMVHVGDTRLYQFHHGILSKLSHDHSYVGYREEVGDLSEEEAMHHPRRNEITRDVGSEHHEIGDINFLEAEQYPLLPNSIFLLCSDGLTDLVTSDEIVRILKLDIDIKDKTQALIDAANNAGGKDNITVVLVEYSASEKNAEDVKPEEENITGPSETTVEEIISSDSEKDKNIISLSNDTLMRMYFSVIGLLAIIIVLLTVLLINQTTKTEKIIAPQISVENQEEAQPPITEDNLYEQQIEKSEE